MKGDIRCVDGRLMRHDPQHDDPELETDRGECPECHGEGRNCSDCGASHAEEHWQDFEPVGHGGPFRETVLHLCTSCADSRRDRWMENHG